MKQRPFAKKGLLATGSITIDAAALQSGTYIYSLFTNGGIADTKKMVVAR